LLSDNQIIIALATIVVLGVGAQWIGRLLGFPSLLLLLPAGLLAGDISGLVEPQKLFGETLFPLVTLLVSAQGVKEALKEQMVAPVRWVRVVETLAKMRVEEWVELGGGGVLTRMLRDFELPSPKDITFEDLRTRRYGRAQNLLPHKEAE
jgi:hypothetical protein